jgi:hypothetical protein
LSNEVTVLIAIQCAYVKYLVVGESPMPYLQEAKWAADIEEGSLEAISAQSKWSCRSNSNAQR